jgi:hypothetical protein
MQCLRGDHDTDLAFARQRLGAENQRSSRNLLKYPRISATKQ